MAARRPSPPGRTRADAIARHLAALPMRVRLAKGAVDWGVALVLLPGLLLCMAILVVANPIWNPGPMFFRQPRVGQGGQIFGVLKFRTLVGEGQGPEFAPTAEARAGRLGAFMRRTRVDEVPQILNVLGGQMSMIGPRPEQVAFVEEYRAAIPGYDLRHTVRPGISGLAQLKLGYTADADGARRKLAWDMVYIANMSVALEWYIVARTAGFVGRRLARTVTRRVSLGRNPR